MSFVTDGRCFDGNRTGRQWATLHRSVRRMRHARGYRGMTLRAMCDIWSSQSAPSALRTDSWVDFKGHDLTKTQRRR